MMCKYNASVECLLIIFARLLLQFKLYAVEFVVLSGFPSLSTWFLHSCRESGHYSWSFVPGYGMVKQACDVMQLYAYVCLPASLFSRKACSVLSFSTGIDIQTIKLGHQSWNQYTLLVRELMLASGRHVFILAEGNGNLQAWAMCWCIIRVH